MSQTQDNEDVTNDEVKDELISNFTVPLLILELISSLLDLISDFLSGFSLLSNYRTFKWGIGSFVINWIPGLVGSVQIFANHRRHPETSLTKVILMCLASIILCPIVPTVTVVYILFNGPRSSEEKDSPQFYTKYTKMLRFLTIVRALEGCLESPLQIVYKIFLMYHGVVSFDFSSVTLIEDAFGNKLPLPFLLNFVIAILSLMKATSTLNINNIIRPSKLSLLTLVPFLISNCLFKLGALMILFGYLSIFAILPLILVFMLSIYVNSRTIEEFRHIPRWVMNFTNICAPLCFTTKRNQDIYDVQVKNLRYQTLNCFSVYGSSLVILGVLVNLSLLNMNEELPINSTKFNVILTSAFAFGVLATLISFKLKPDFKNKYITYSTLIGQVVLVMAIFTTSISWLANIPNDDAYIVFKTNHTYLDIIQVKEIVPIDRDNTILDSRKIGIFNGTDFQKHIKEVQTLDAIIIINQENFKPSSPYNSLFGKGNYVRIPTLLVRKENALDILAIGKFTQHVELTKKVYLEKYGFNPLGE